MFKYWQEWGINPNDDGGGETQRPSRMEPVVAEARRTPISSPLKEA